MTLARILREYQVPQDQVTGTLINGLMVSNLENVLVALEDAPSNDTIEDLLRRTRSINKLKLPKEEKREIIKKGLAGYDKIKTRYFRGYPQKEEN